MAPRAASRRRPPATAEPIVPTRELILDAAERLFADRGLEGVAVRDLARELGITPSSLYNHFPSKQALYDAVIVRGLGPIVEITSRAWQPGGLSPDRVGATLDELLAHLARHSHLGRLFQRALFEDSESTRRLLVPFVEVLYREGVGVLRKAAGQAGWTPAEVPHLALGLFGMIFGYFTNAPALRRVMNRGDEPLMERSLAVQRQFLEKAILRLLGSTPPPGGHRRKERS